MTENELADLETHIERCKALGNSKCPVLINQLQQLIADSRELAAMAPIFREAAGKSAGKPLEGHLPLGSVMGSAHTKIGRWR